MLFFFKSRVRPRLGGPFYFLLIRLSGLLRRVGSLILTLVGRLGLVGPLVLAVIRRSGVV
jgi:hypothetical protein